MILWGPEPFCVVRLGPIEIPAPPSPLYLSYFLDNNKLWGGPRQL